MVTAYLQQPLFQDDIARWLGTDDLGTPASRIQRMSRRGFEVAYSDTSSLADLEAWLKNQIPPILFIRTGELSYWPIDTQHAVVLAGLTTGVAYIFDPSSDNAPVTVSSDELLLAWSHFDYTYATLTVG
jgi:ABC-type bacteriocin/lantibiotic exporter with double-glycine peptidase domain